MPRTILVSIFACVGLLMASVEASAQTCLPWLQAETVPSEFIIQYSRGAYDTQRNVMVFFGGPYDANVTEYDGSVWTEIPAKGPGARRHHAMAFDSLRQVVVMFGGQAEGTYQRLGGTWEWNGSQWSLASTSGPSARVGHAMVFDVALGKMVLFGGSDGFSDRADTWTWDGITWTELAISGPSARRFHSMAYDAERERVVLFGGAGIVSQNDETWEFDGVAWAQQLATGPGPREQHEMAYDADRHLTIMFDGVYLGTGTWAWDGASWQSQEDFSRPRPISGDGYVLWYDKPNHVTRLLSNGFENIWMFGIGNLFFGGQPPVDQSVLENTPAILRFDLELYDSALCQSTGPAAIQWRWNSVPVVDGGRYLGSQTNALGIFPTQLSDAGDYDVVITRPCGAVTTLPVVLSVTPADIEPCFLRADIDESGWVDFDDIVEVLSKWGLTCP